MFSRRNAIVGFLILKLLKQGARRKLPSVPLSPSKNERPWGRWVAIGFAGVLVGAFVGGLLWKRRSSGEADFSEFGVSDAAFEGFVPPDVPVADELGDGAAAAETALEETADSPAE
jgi:hypothetical protein